MGNERLPTGSNQAWDERITKSQIICLRLVAKGMTSKEIALQTGLSPGTVDQYVNRAASLLGASSRREAARMLIKLEETGLKEFQLKPEAVARLDQPVSLTSVERGAPVHRNVRKFLDWIPPLGGERHDLSFRETTLEIVKAATIATVTFAGIVASGAWLHSLFN